MLKGRSQLEVVFCAQATKDMLGIGFTGYSDVLHKVLSEEGAFLPFDSAIWAMAASKAN